MAMTLSKCFEKELTGGIGIGGSHKQKKEVQASHKRGGMKHPEQYVCMGREVYALIQELLKQRLLHHEVMNPVLQQYLNTQWKHRKQLIDMLEEREKQLCGCIQLVRMHCISYS